LYYRRLELSLQRLTDSDDDDDDDDNDETATTNDNRSLSRQARARQRVAALATRLQRRLAPLKTIADGLQIPEAIHEKLYR
jgi:hypothetical protein